uniref:Uncharacterized protein n=1 Tax=Ixodes ricinus TaxID=34613 RepID=A0A6B0VB06_IXORI
MVGTWTRVAQYDFTPLLAHLTVVLMVGLVAVVLGVRVWEARSGLGLLLLLGLLGASLFGGGRGGLVTLGRGRSHILRLFQRSLKVSVALVAHAVLFLRALLLALADATQLDLKQGHRLLLFGFAPTRPLSIVVLGGGSGGSGRGRHPRLAHGAVVLVERVVSVGVVPQELVPLGRDEQHDLGHRDFGVGLGDEGPHMLREELVARQVLVVRVRVLHGHVLQAQLRAHLRRALVLLRLRSGSRRGLRSLFHAGLLGGLPVDDIVAVVIRLGPQELTVTVLVVFLRGSPLLLLLLALLALSVPALALALLALGFLGLGGGFGGLLVLVGPPARALGVLVDPATRTAQVRRRGSPGRCPVRLLAGPPAAPAPARVFVVLVLFRRFRTG